MIGALWILLFIIVVGIVLYLFELRGRRKGWCFGVGVR